jgi:integrase
VIKTAWRLQLMTGEQCMRACAVKNLTGNASVPGRVMEDDEIGRLRDAFRAMQGHYGALLSGLFAVFIGGGLRREEVCKLPADALTDRTLRVLGKGNKTREIPLGKEPAADLKRWLTSRRAIGVTQHGMLFTRVRLESGVEVVRPDQPISTDTMDRIIRQWAKYSAPLDFQWIDEEDGKPNSPPALTPHDLRRTFITRLLDNGVDVFTVQKLAGHASSKTTERYDRRSQKAAERAIDEKGVY